jgi:hypothetical protein
MRLILSILSIMLFIGNVFLSASSRPRKEFLTGEEVAAVRNAQEIDERVKVYMQAAALRLKSAEDRIKGIESAEGDPLEFFSTEDMLDGYYRIIDSVMMNLDAAYQDPQSDQARIRKALVLLKAETEKTGKSLEALKSMAEKMNKEGLWNLANKAIEITESVREGADYGLSKLLTPSEKKKSKQH